MQINNELIEGTEVFLTSDKIFFLNHIRVSFPSDGCVDDIVNFSHSHTFHEWHRSVLVELYEELFLMSISL